MEKYSALIVEDVKEDLRLYLPASIIALSLNRENRSGIDSERSREFNRKQ